MSQKFTIRRTKLKVMFEGMSAVGGVLSALTLLTVCKLSTDMLIANPEAFEECVAVILVGSLLSAVLLFWQF